MAKGKWCAMANVIGGKMKYIAGRILDEDEPLHSGNIEHFGEYTEDEATVCEIAEALNKAEEAKANPRVKNDTEKAPFEEESGNKQRRGWRIEITDLESGEKTVFEEASCFFGSIAYKEKDDMIAVNGISQVRASSGVVERALSMLDNVKTKMTLEVYEKRYPGISDKVYGTAEKIAKIISNAFGDLNDENSCETTE